MSKKSYSSTEVDVRVFNPFLRVVLLMFNVSGVKVVSISRSSNETMYKKS